MHVERVLNKILRCFLVKIFLLLVHSAQRLRSGVILLLFSGLSVCLCLLFVNMITLKPLASRNIMTFHGVMLCSDGQKLGWTPATSVVF